MKLFFLENDSFYKIYKTLEKLPEHKKVTCFIDIANPIFDNIRRGKQICNLIKNRKLQIIWIAKNEKAKNFFEEAGLPYEYKYRNKRERNIHLTYLFLFENKTFQQSWINKADYIKHIVRAIEFLFIGLILYGIYLFVWPSARLIITPTYTLQDIVYNFRYYPRQTDIFDVEQDRLSIPYQQGSIEHTITMKQPVSNLAQAQTRASGTITLYNTSDNSYDIIANSTFITDDGLLFKAPTSFSIPAKISDQTP
ncbi:MAG: hypothetical protein H6766_00600 [Candidatus Peribacteria bacterium]|nr:MAG: hypothetical protein H6766_00600 [Candidatus Peribacteria bacterium]